jgi:hypothetical protein
MRHNEEAHISSFLIMQAPRNYLPEAIENSPSGASISLSMEVRDHLLGGLVADLVPFHFSGPISLCEKTTSGCLVPRLRVFEPPMKIWILIAYDSEMRLHSEPRKARFKLRILLPRRIIGCQSSERFKDEIKQGERSDSRAETSDLPLQAQA